MHELLNTDRIHSSRQFRYWLDYFESNHFKNSPVGSIRTSVPFSAHIYGDLLNDLSIGTWGYKTPLQIIQYERTSLHLSQDSIEVYMLAYSTHPTIIWQNGKETLIPAHYFGLYTSEPFHITCPNVNNGYYLMIPRHYLSSKLFNADVKGARIADGRKGLARVLFEYLRQMINELRTFSVVDKYILSECIINLIPIIFSPSKDSLEVFSTTNKERHYKEIVQFIHLNCNDSDLTAKGIANNLRISPYKLSRLLSEHDTSFYELINARRILNCALDLSNPRSAMLSISTIAYKNGFNNVSHFCKRFKEKYGCSPKEYRANKLSFQCDIQCDSI